LLDYQNNYVKRLRWLLELSKPYAALFIMF